MKLINESGFATRTVFALLVRQCYHVIDTPGMRDRLVVRVIDSRGPVLVVEPHQPVGGWQRVQVRIPVDWQTRFGPWSVFAPMLAERAAKAFWLLQWRRTRHRDRPALLRRRKSKRATWLRDYQTAALIPLEWRPPESRRRARLAALLLTLTNRRRDLEARLVRTERAIFRVKRYRQKVKERLAEAERDEKRVYDIEAERGIG